MIVRRKTFVELKAKFMEYEHAIDHVAEHGNPDFAEFYGGQPHCEGCRQVAQSAIDGVNRDDFREIATEYTGLRGRLRSLYYSIRY